MVLHGIALHCVISVLYGMVLYFIVLHGIACHCIVSYGMAWYCMVLHCTIVGFGARAVSRKTPIYFILTALCYICFRYQNLKRGTTLCVSLCLLSSCPVSRHTSCWESRLYHQICIPSVSSNLYQICITSVSSNPTTRIPNSSSSATKRTDGNILETKELWEIHWCQNDRYHIFKTKLGIFLKKCAKRIFL